MGWLPWIVLLAAGCQSTPHRDFDQGAVSPIHDDMPNELCKVTIPEYVIAPPDILLIDAVRITPRPPYRLKTGDEIGVSLRNPLPEEPLSAAVVLEPGGFVDLGFAYGRVNVGHLTVAEAREAITQHLKQWIETPQLHVALTRLAANQPINGEHLVAPDGYVTLGVYGRVFVTGMTILQARNAVEFHLSQFLEDPQISLDVFSYNSKFFYIITEGAGLGDGVNRIPFTGGETVLDAIAHLNGLTQVSSKRIWIARPSHKTQDVQILPVDWNAVSKLGMPATNYQLLPGDRVFIAEDRLVTFDNKLAKLLAPFERLFGFTLLGTGTVTRLSGNVLEGGGARGGIGGGAGGIGGF